MPPSLGHRLKHAREKRGLSLRDVEHMTRIPMGKLQDLEDDKLNTFGGMVYGKSFLRTYASLLNVDAEDVLKQMQPPPLGGVRDYRYLVETHGPWVTEKPDRRTQPAGAPSALAEGKSFLFAAFICFAFALLIGGGVLANAYLNTRSLSPSGQNKPPSSDNSSSATAAALSAANTDASATSQPGAPVGEATSLHRDAFLPPDDLADAEGQEFSLFGVHVTIVPENAPRESNSSSASSITPPKAQAVSDDSATPAPRKAQAVQ